MADAKKKKKPARLPRRGRGKRTPLPLDELGGFADGGLAIVGTDEAVIHRTPAKVAASLRYFVARVQLHDATGLPGRIAMTSSLSGEGVSYLTKSLAAVIAYDTPSSVVVVELNWRRPRPPGAEGERPLGLSDVVDGDASLDQLIVPTTNPRLSIVRAGEVPVARRPALAGSEALADACDDLAKRFDHVLFDVPPVLASAEAMSLSQLADVFVLVVLQGVTAQSQVEAALEEMRGAHPLGVILNRYDSRIPRRLRRLVGA